MQTCMCSCVDIHITNIYIYIMYICMCIHTCLHISTNHGSGRAIYDALDLQHLIRFSDCCISMWKPV